MSLSDPDISFLEETSFSLSVTSSIPSSSPWFEDPRVMRKIIKPVVAATRTHRNNPVLISEGNRHVDCFVRGVRKGPGEDLCEEDEGGGGGEDVMDPARLLCVLCTVWSLCGLGVSTGSRGRTAREDLYEGV